MLCFVAPWRAALTVDARGTGSTGERGTSLAAPEPRMKSTLELVIRAPLPEVAALFSEPRQNPEWMDEAAWVEPLRGQLGETGSAYRIVPKEGRGAFVATVVTRRLPDEVRLVLERDDMSVAIEGRFVPISAEHTKLISEETFTFKGVLGKVMGLFARRAMRRAHRLHMEQFKRLAESRALA
jgi:hypothetical protein